MPIAHVPYDDELLLTSGRSPEEMEREFRLLLAAKLFELGRLSLGQAAKLAGRGKVDFLFELGALGISSLNHGPEGLAHEVHES
jgi:predicted HTH domain antitoxin